MIVVWQQYCACYLHGQSQQNDNACVTTAAHICDNADKRRMYIIYLLFNLELLGSDKAGLLYLVSAESRDSRASRYRGSKIYLTTHCIPRAMSMPFMLMYHFSFCVSRAFFKMWQNCSKNSKALRIYNQAFS